MANERINIILSATDSATPQLQKVNRELAKTETTVGNLGGEGSGSVGGFAQLGTAMNAAVAGFGVAGFASVVSDLNKIGTEAQGMSQIFEAMAGSTANADAMLNQLRATTGNVVSDFDLMSGASQLMRMGLASNAEEVNQLIEMAVKLKKPTESASEAIENFSLMLANQSVARLDSFGIASGTVRARIDELLASGQALNREEAFTMAVMEQGEQAILRLGDAADISVTAVNKLETKFANLRAELGMVVSSAIEAGAQLLMLPGMMQRLDVQQDAAAYAEANNINPENLTYEQTKVTILGQEIILDESGHATTPLDIGAMFAGQKRAMGSLLPDMGSSILDSMLGMTGEAGQYATDSSFGDFQSLYGNLQNQSFQGRGNMGLMSETSIAAAISGYEQIKGMADELRDNPFIRDEQVESIDRMVDGAKQLADEAVKAREAFENMTLDQMLGKEDGGRLGELSDLVMENLSEGADSEGIQSDFDMATGRQTELGSAIEDDIAPQLAEITEKLGTEAGVNAMEAVLAAIEQGQVAGHTDEQIANAAQLAMFQSTPLGQGIDQFAGQLFGGGGLLPTFGAPMGDAEGGEGMSGGLLGSMDLTEPLAGIEGLKEKVTELGEVAGEVRMTGMENSAMAIMGPIEASAGYIEDMAVDREMTFTVTFKTGKDSDPEAIAALADGMSKVTANNGGATPYP
jgi:hypothetical protein